MHSLIVKSSLELLVALSVALVVSLIAGGFALLVLLEGIDIGDVKWVEEGFGVFLKGEKFNGREHFLHSQLVIGILELWLYISVDIKDGFFVEV